MPIEEEKKGSGADFDPGSSAVPTFPLELKITDKNFKIERGRVEGFLFQANQKGNVREKKLIT